MLRSFFILPIMCAVSAATGQALPTASGPGSHVTVGGGLSWYQQDYGHRQIGGAYSSLELHPHWRYGFVGEVRMLRLNTDQQVTETNYLAGIKAGVFRRPARTEPYVKMLVGAGRITLPFNYAHGTFLACAAGGGINYSLSDRWTWRIADFEVQRWTGFPYGNLQPYGISSGITLRLNPMRRFPSASASAR